MLELKLATPSARALRRSHAYTCGRRGYARTTHTQMHTHTHGVHYVARQRPRHRGREKDSERPAEECCTTIEQLEYFH
jgi:hypothetical protein